jgi:hypothetical protein
MSRRNSSYYIMPDFKGLVSHQYHISGISSINGIEKPLCIQKSKETLMEMLFAEYQHGTYSNIGINHKN